MISQETINKIKELVNEFFQKTTLDVSVEFLPEQEGTIPVNIESEEPQILIGEGGQTLIDIQRLLKLSLKKKVSEDFYIDLDVNGYKKKKIEYLKEIARAGADEVSLTKKEKELAPMPAYERRIVHLELLSRIDVIGESVGNDPGRRIVIKPKP
jgi:spoIIIJ-associated protein